MKYVQQNERFQMAKYYIILIICALSLVALAAYALVNILTGIFQGFPGGL